jgi:hypothetical protein
LGREITIDREGSRPNIVFRAGDEQLPPVLAAECAIDWTVTVRIYFCHPSYYVKEKRSEVVARSGLIGF